MSAAAAARTEGQRFEYKRREPQDQVLHKLVREHLEPFLTYTQEHYRKPLPKHVERELRGLLRCGDSWHGFTRVRCPRCRHEFFVAFSCGGSMNCHTHLHVIVIDGVYSRQDGGTTRFHFVEPPSAQELASMVATICERVCRMLGRRGLIGEASHDGNEVRLPEAALDGCRSVALSRGRFERLDEQGRAQQKLFPDDEQGMRRTKDGRWAAAFDVTGEPVPSWVIGMDPDERGPPTDWEFVD